MTTNYKNHTKLINFLEENHSYVLKEYKDNLEGLEFMDNNKTINLKIWEVYWKMVKDLQLKTMQEIFNEMFPKWQYPTYEANLLKEVVKFQKENFDLKQIEHTYIHNGYTIIGEQTEYIDRAIKKLENSEQTTVYERSYFEDSESDYETAIEIVTTEIYVVPKYKYTKIDNNTLFVCRDTNKCYFKSSYQYDMKSYGTQWM
jgi:hypothetical protein